MILDGIRNQKNNECEIHGKRVFYEGCSTNSIKKAKAYYGSDWEYIGSGYKTWHDGVENNWKEKHHFFIRKL